MSKGRNGELKNICRRSLKKKLYKNFIDIVSHNLSKICFYAESYLKEDISVAILIL